jgi:hypothetical protein
MVLDRAEIFVGVEKKIHTFLGKIGTLTLEGHIRFESLHCKVSQMTKFLIKAFSNTTPKQHYLTGAAQVTQILNNIYNCFGGTLLCSVFFG